MDHHPAPEPPANPTGSSFRPRRSRKSTSATSSMRGRGGRRITTKKTQHSPDSPGEMAENPRNMLHKLVEIAVGLCRADTAGVSVLDGDVFRWEAVAGVFANARGGTMPRAESPCGVCIDRDATQLMHLADRCFPALFAEPRFVEALLIPFHHRGKPVGTIWIVSHSFEKRFNREDERNVRVLARFASAGWDFWKNVEATTEINRRKDDFLAVLGHELRNPFAAITAAASVFGCESPTMTAPPARLM